MKRVGFYLFVFFSLLLADCYESEEGASDDVRVGLLDAIATYEFEREMYVDAVHRVELVISKAISKELIQEIAPSFYDSANLKSDTVKVGEMVWANLLDPYQKYRITPLSLERQSMLSKDSFGLLWQWDVIPLEEGNFPLSLKALTRVNGQDFDIKVFDANIKVSAQPGEGNSLVPYVGAGLFVLIGLLLSIFRMRKKKIGAKERAVILPDQLVKDLNRLIGEGQTLDAIEQLEKHLEAADSDKLKDLILLKSSFVENKRKRDLNIISSEDEGIESSRVNLAVLDLIEGMKPN